MADTPSNTPDADAAGAHPPPAPAADQPPAADEPMVELRWGERRVTLLGTAHVSRSSAAAVERLLASGAYDAVAVELCPSRYNALMDPDALQKMDLIQVLRQGKAAFVVANLALGAYQQRLAEQLDVEPGAEMRVAIEQARRAHLPVLLIDREISVSLKRVYRNVPWWQRFNLLSGLLASVVSRHQVTEEEVEALKEGDVLEATFNQFAMESEKIYGPLVDERDRYMAARIQQEMEKTEHQHVLAVVGAGHLRGIQRYLEAAAPQPPQAERVVEELDQVPPPGKFLKIFSWTVVALIITAFIIGFSRNPELGRLLVWEWVLINGGLAALGTIIAAGHPLTVVGAFVAAPITSLIPIIGAGMVTAVLETFLRKPKVSDFERLRKDTQSARGWWRNRVARVLLVFVFSTLGSAIGTYAAGFRIFDHLWG